MFKNYNYFSYLLRFTFQGNRMILLLASLGKLYLLTIDWNNHFFLCLWIFCYLFNIYSVPGILLLTGFNDL